jgi:hypothetical protein
MLDALATMAKTDPEVREMLIRDGFGSWIEVDDPNPMPPSPACKPDPEPAGAYSPIDYDCGFGDETVYAGGTGEVRLSQEDYERLQYNADLDAKVEAAVHRVLGPQVEKIQKAADDLLVAHRVSGEKDRYSPEDVSVILTAKGWKGCSEFTVRESWCNKDGRIEADKDPDNGHWLISHAELQRILQQGRPDPPGTHDNHGRRKRKR